MARSSAKRKQVSNRAIPPEETVEEIVSFAFDKAVAEKAYKDLLNTIASLAKHEAGRTNKYREFAKAGYAFCITLIPPGRELDKMKVRVGETDTKVPGLPKSIQDFLSARGLELPYRGTARNPYMGILSPLWDRAAKKHPELMSETNEDEKGRPNYIAISRWSWVVCAAIDQNKPELLDDNPDKVAKDYLEYRRTNPTLALPPLEKPKAEEPTTREPTEEDIAKAKAEFEKRKAAAHVAAFGTASSYYVPEETPQEPHPGEGFHYQPEPDEPWAGIAPDAASPEPEIPTRVIPQSVIITQESTPRRLRHEAYDFLEITQSNMDELKDSFCVVIRVGEGMRFWKVLNPPEGMVEAIAKLPKE